jgi:uncharacterized repeat protein (TIGR01451 family)
MKFEATAGGSGAWLVFSTYKAVTGSLANVKNIVLYREQNGTLVKAGTGSINGNTFYFYGASVVPARTIQPGQTAVFVVKADIQPTATVGSVVQVGFNTSTAGYIGATFLGGRGLNGIETDGLCLLFCEIKVTTRASTLWIIQGPAAVCGNGVIEGSEVCDDGGHLAGDGCAPDCSAVEAGWVCLRSDSDAGPYSPSRPQSSCNYCSSSETDPTNHVYRRAVVMSKMVTGEVVNALQNEDICIGNQYAEWSCDELNLATPSEPQACPNNGKCEDGACVKIVGSPSCGNGTVEATANDSIHETCDRGAENGRVCTIKNGDVNCFWCNSQCQIRVMWAPNCGDGKIDAGEQCDDANHYNGDGCSAGQTGPTGGCRIESGWTCTGAPSSCSRTPARVDVSVVKTGFPTAVSRTGTGVTYSLRVTASGASAAKNVVVVDTFPRELTFSRAVAPAGVQCTQSGTTVTCPLGDVQPGIMNGKNIQLYFIAPVVTPCTTVNVTNRATVSTTSVDLNTANNQSSVQTSLTCPPPVTFTNATAARKKSTSAYDTISFTASMKNGSTAIIQSNAVLAVSCLPTTEYPSGFRASNGIGRAISPGQTVDIIINGAYLISPTKALTATCTFSLTYNGVAIAVPLTRLFSVLPKQPRVLTRQIFYNNSVFDIFNDAAAIAPDKLALVKGQTATFANYTSYDKGINGIYIDIQDLATTGTLSAASDFSFRVGNSNTPSAWAVAPNPTITIQRGAGLLGSDRVFLIWPDRAIAKTWLQVTVKATAATGLSANDVFYYGNAVGESGQGNTTQFAFVTVTDELAARNASKASALITDVVDYNRDGKVNVTDELIARANATNLTNALKLILPQ